MTKTIELPEPWAHRVKSGERWYICPSKEYYEDTKHLGNTFEGLFTVDHMREFAALTKSHERPWQGLTEEEISSALGKYQGWREFAAHLENILKEKNQ